MHFCFYSGQEQVLKDKIQCDEKYFNESFKGNHKNSKFVMPRKPHKRGSSCHLRGISHQKVCVLTALDLHLNHIKIPSTKHRLNNYNIQKINSLHSKIKSSPLLIKGEQPFRNSNFKGRPPICTRLGLLIPFITN